MQEWYRPSPPRQEAWALFGLGGRCALRSRFSKCASFRVISSTPIIPFHHKIKRTSAIAVVGHERKLDDAMRYDVNDLMGWRTFLFKAGTVWDNQELWTSEGNS